MDSDNELPRVVCVSGTVYRWLSQPFIVYRWVLVLLGAWCAVSGANVATQAADSQAPLPTAAATSIAVSNDANTLTPVDGVELFKATITNVEQAELDLPQVLEMALEANPNLKAAGDRTRQARERYYTKLAEMLPDVGVSYSRSHYNGGLQIFGNQIIDVNRTIQQPSLVMKFPLFKGGVDFFQMRSAGKALSAQKATELMTQQATLRETAVRYYDLKRSLSELKIAFSQVKTLEEHLKLTQVRMDAGVGTRLDVMQTQAQLAKAKQGWIQASQAVQLTALELNNLLDLPAMVQPMPKTESVDLVALIPEEVPMALLISQGKAKRMDLVSIDKQIDAQKELRKIALTALLPEVNFNVQVGATGPTLSNTKDFGSNTFSVDLLLRDLGLSAWTRWREKTAQIQELMHQRQAQENQIEKDIQQALIQSLSLKAVMKEVKIEIESAQLALNDAIERLKVGVGRNVDVLDAESQLTQAKQRLNVTTAQYNQAQVNLVSALGLTSVDTLTQGVNPAP